MSVFTTEPHALLKIAVDDSVYLDELYEKSIEKHNKKMNEVFPDSGFDLFVPDDVYFNEGFKTNMIDMKIKMEMLYYEPVSQMYKHCGYYSYPRSSISKTPLMLANHVGIIDSGYRGNLKGAFRWLNNDNEVSEYKVEKGSRLLQICHPSLCPIFVEKISTNELSTTQRGSGGFGSTGK